MKLRTILGALGGAALAATMAYAATTTLTLGTSGGPGGVIILEGSTSGSVTIQPPAVAGATVITLPATPASTKCLHEDNTGVISAAASDCGVGGGGTIASTTSALAGDGTGNAVAVTGTGTNCVLVNGSSAACGGGGATGLGVQGGQSPSDIGDNATALPSGHYYYATNANMTAQRTHPMPDSATQGVGDLEIFDAQQTATATNQLCVQAAGTDKINTVTNGTACITTAGGSIYFHNDGAGNYTTGAAANIPAPTNGQIIVGKTGSPSNSLAAVTPSQDCTMTNAGVFTCLKTNNVAFSALATTTPGAGVATALGTAQGNGTKVQLSTGAGTSGKCVEFDANGNTVVAASNAACGSGGGGGTLINNSIGGCTLSNDGTTPTTKLDISACTAADSTNATTISGSAIIKTTGAFVAGTGNGGMGTGGGGLTVANNTWYHVCAATISAAYDVFFDTDVACSTHKPAGTTAARRVGSFRSQAASTSIELFFQHGDEFVWKGQQLDQSNITLTATPAALTLNGVPPGVSVKAHYSVYMGSGGTGFTFYDPEASSSASLVGGYASFGNVPAGGAGELWTVTNTSGQIEGVADASRAGVYINTVGYRDFRGQ